MTDDRDVLARAGQRLRERLAVPALDDLRTGDAEAEATRIQDLYLDGKKDEAAAAVPTSMVEDVYLVGPKEKIRDDLDAWKESIVTTMLVAGDPALLRTMAELVL